MSDLNATELTSEPKNIEGLLAEYENLINSDRSIPEITSEINHLSEQIEAYFRQLDTDESTALSASEQHAANDNPAPEHQTEKSNNSAPVDETPDETDVEIFEEAVDKKETNTVHDQWDRLTRSYRKKRRKYYEERNKDQQENLKKRMALIESFKGLLKVEEDITHTLKTFKGLQEEWYAAGPIPKNDYEMVWQTYRHHVENFYDYLDLNREFRDLDFKYNYDQKLRIINQAQQLLNLEDQTMAFKELQKLHKIWKEDIGPVAKEHREPLWQAFSEVTKTIHDKRQSFLLQREGEQIENLARKKAIIQEIAAIAGQNETSHKYWQKSVKRVQKLRDEFFNLGPVPKQENKSLWAEFKEVTKNYSQAKNTFFKDQKKQQMANLKAKKELIQRAEQHLESNDFGHSTPLMKKIQSDWRKIGPVPHRDSDKIWKRFKTACNTYFDKVHSEHKLESDAEQKALAKKKALLKSIEYNKASHYKKVEDLKSEAQQWHAAGKIPAKQTALEDKFFDCIKMHLTHLGQSEHEANLTSFNLKIEGYAAHGQDQLLLQQGQLVEQKIKELKTEINQLENNLGFFQNVAKDNPLVQEVHNNIAGYRNDLNLWQEKKEILRRL
jgi:hypothetical protein